MNDEKKKFAVTCKVLPKDYEIEAESLEEAEEIAEQQYADAIWRGVETIYATATEVEDERN